MPDHRQDWFVLNDQALVVSAPALTLGGMASGQDVMLRGHTGNAMLRICYRRYCHWVEPLPNQPLALLNCRPIDRRLPLNNDDELSLGSVIVRFTEACPETASPLLDVSLRTGAVHLPSGVELTRIVLLRHRLQIAARPPCHVGLANLGADVLEIARDDRGRLTCESTTGTSTLEIPGSPASCWTQPVCIPGELLVRPLARDLASRRDDVRLIFRPA